MSKRTRRGIWITFSSLLLMIIGLCCAPYLFTRTIRTVIASTQPSAGHVVHVTGWNGPVAGDRDFLIALRDAGCTQSMEAWDWTEGRRGLFALWRSQHNDAPARQLADHLRMRWHHHPGAPIYITADSSGCGVALDAIAMLPSEVRIETVILSSPAVSCDYDLVPTLTHIDGNIVSFNSTRDWMILGVGTTLFGTVDRKHTSSAGKNGFKLPTRDAAKLIQYTHDPSWNRAGHDGHHARSLQPAFAKQYIAPILRR